MAPPQPRDPALAAKSFFGDFMSLVYGALGSTSSLRGPVDRMELYLFLNMLLTGVLVLFVFLMLCGTAWGVCKRRAKKRRSRYHLPAAEKDNFQPFEV